MNTPVSGASLETAQSLVPNAASLQALFDHISEGAAERDEKRILPFDIIHLIRSARIGALRIPIAAGGGGSSIRELIKVIIRLGEADPNVAHILRNHFSVVERLVRTPFNSRSQQWQKAVVDGAIIGFAASELGTEKVGDVRFNTVLTADGDGYRLNGTKYYSTGSLYADYILVRADYNESSTALLVPAKREGIELVDDWDGIGQRLTGTGTTYFRDVRVEAGEVVFDSADAGYGAPYANTFAQLFLTAINAGIARAIANEATALVKRRGRNFYYAPSERTTDDPLLQRIVGQLSSHAFASESAVLASADALDAEADARDAGSPSLELAAQAALQAAQAKIIVDDLTLRSGSLLFDVGAASATKRSANLDRHWRNARTLASHNPSTHKARAIGDLAINETPLPTKGYF